MAARNLLLAACLIVAALAMACGGGGANSSRETPTAVPTPTAERTADADGGQDVPAAEPSQVVDLASEPALITLGPQSDELQTGGVSAARGDFNGDGVDDLLVGAPFADGPDGTREDAGEAYVVFGPVDRAEVDLTAEASVTVLGALAGDNLGFSVIGGDLNADGTDDIVVGAPGSNALKNIRTDMGEAYVVFGSSSLAGTIDLGKLEQDFTFRPAEGFTRVGTSFAVGDVNADGVDDLIAGGPFGGRVEGTPPGSPRTTVGEVYVIFGSPQLGGDTDLALGEADVRLKGAQELDSFGQAVASGDVNGDGVDDIVATARRADGPADARSEAGEAQIFFGSPSLKGLIESNAADVTVYGAEAGDGLGESAASGDLNGDGLADVVLSDQFAGGPKNVRPGSGEAVVIFGAEDLPATIDLATDGPGSVIYGRDESDVLPSGIALADFDGDGRTDLALGAPLADGPQNGREDSGEAYILSGPAIAGEIDLRSDTDGTLFVFGPEAGDELGMVLAGLDLNGNGARELLMLAPGSAGDAGAEGKLYLIELP